MNDTNRKIIDAVIARAEKICPGSLALIGIYGSVATGDDYAKSDLDLLILIQDNDGWKLGTGFILDDNGVGYDIYCTNWEGLKGDAECHHAKLSKLMDSEIVYVKNQEAYEELLRLREQVGTFLQSEERFKRVDALLEKAKVSFANACLQDDIGKVRICAGEVIVLLSDAVMLYHGCYFKRGTKRTLDELSQLPLDPAFADNIRAIPLCRDVSELRELIRQLVQYAESHTSRKKAEPSDPTAESIRGTYEEIYSNWRNKVAEAAAADDHFSSFMNILFLQYMIDEIAGSVQIGSHDLMASYDPDCPANNIELFDRFLEEYEKVYEKAGLDVRRFANADAFAADYVNAD